MLRLKGKAAALRTLEIDDGLAEAHTALASATKVWDRDWARAEGQYRGALELNPHYALGYRAFAAEGLGDNPASLEALKQAYGPHDVWLVWLKADPRLDGLRGEPAFERIAAARRFAARSGGEVGWALGCRATRTCDSFLAEASGGRTHLRYESTARRI